MRAETAGGSMMNEQTKLSVKLIFLASNIFSLEDAFKNDQKSIEILIAGHMYKIDFEEGVQARATYKPLLPIQWIFSFENTPNFWCVIEV